MSHKIKKVGFEIDETLWRKLKIKAVEQGKTLRQLLTEIIAQYVGDGQQ